MNLEPVIGLEVHVELATKTKMFCGCPTSFGASPNTQVCPVCLGMPGVLPVINKEAVKLAIKTALALNCKINLFTRFDRKNYYYPDLPKNYQISQQYLPLGVEGWLEISLKEGSKKVRIHNLHLEEDAGKNLHLEGTDYSLVDLNRAGIPLIEIVTYPDMRTLEEVEVFMNTLREILIYIGASDCRMEEGHLRFEANVSLRPKGSKTLGPKVEMKNLNSFKMVLNALKYEIERQSKVIQRGGKVVQETRLWDSERGISLPMRYKEEAQDYRYFPEPDLPPLDLPPEWIEEIRQELPELPQERRKRLKEKWGLTPQEADLLVGEKELGDFFDECIKIYPHPKSICSWLLGPVLRELRERKISLKESPLTPEYLVSISKMVEEEKITQTNAKFCLYEVFQTKKAPEKIIEEKGWIQVSDKGELEGIVDKVIEENPKPVEDYRRGKTQALGFLIGRVMRLTGGKANPKVVRELLQEKLK